MITEDKVPAIFCTIDEFDKEFESLIENQPMLSMNGRCRRRRKAILSDIEIMTIMLVFHFGTFRYFKYFYTFFIRQHLSMYFPEAVSYNRFGKLIRGRSSK